MKSPKQPSLETRFLISVMGFMIPMAIMIFSSIFNINLSDDFRQLLVFIWHSFFATIAIDEIILIANVFILGQKDGISEIKTIPTFNPNKTYSVRTRQTTKGYVYLLSALHDNSLFKIGRTNNPNDRLRTFNVKLPFAVDFICVIQTEDMYLLERQLHGKYANKRLEGEWFALSSEDVDYIKGLANA